MEAAEELERVREKRLLSILRASQFGGDDYKKFLKAMFGE